VVEELGADSYLYGICAVEGTPHDIIVRVDDRGVVRKGDVVHVVPDPQKVHVFDADHGRRISS
jgi:multiple sugar transport system ATP-binding protein